MSLSTQEIVSATTCDPGKDFIYNGDAFVLISWEKGRFDFKDYGVCIDYSLSSSTENDIITMRYFSLSNFPPFPATMTMTADEIIKGKICIDGKTLEFKKFNNTFSINVEVLDQFENMIPFKRKLCTA